jgi:hypothetical protein
MAKPPKETDLYAPVRDYLVRNGYTVRGEVKGCDITAVKGDDLVVVELKRHLSTDLLVQAVQRQKLTDSVYVAVPRNQEMGYGRKWRGLLHLMRRLELGLIVVSFSIEPPHVEIAGHPTPIERRKQKHARRAVLTEIAERSGDFNQGGSTKRKLVTAYREQAIRIAVCLQAQGPSSPKALRDLGTGKKTSSILHSNYYGWFDHVGRALYALNGVGEKGLEEYASLAEAVRVELAKRPKAD